jgi:tRNA A-37 threonylcarbamoyl transferase component Bud32
MPEPTPFRPSADRNLLLGILALQMDFINREALIQAMHAWVLEKAKPLGQILQEQGALRADARALLEPLVDKHLELHGHDAEKSLASVSSIGSVRQELEQIADPDLQASLAHVSAGRQADDDPWATRPPDSVGVPTSSGLRFRILRPHAKGGLGHVSVALDEELHREVALKEIQEQHADHPDSRARFVLEAEITGGLEHPGIVPVYGLGNYADGRPFYAMRFIRGDSLKEAIQRFHDAEKPGRKVGERTLALRELLGRFVDVCNAVAYAHSRGVLHRDLKPSNVMLGKYGETLLVDWGLAKPLGRVEGEIPSEEGALQPASASGADPTRMGAAIGTPAYMSPEQAAGQLDRLGPASDVYSLGATLYCLLTGRPPFEDQDVGVLLQKVKRGEFPRPRQVNQRVPAALEAICLKAMALQPQERYAAPRELADDIEHWLADEPIKICREAFSARAARWVRRHRVVAAGALMLLLTATIGLGVGLYFVNAEKDRTEAARQGEAGQRQLAEQERNRALDAAAEAQAVLAFFQDQVLAAARPEGQGGGLGITATVLAAVDAAEPKIAGAFAERPLVEASIRHTLGLTYSYLRQDKAAIRQFERVLELRRGEFDPDHPDTLKTMSNLALAYQAAGQLDKALPLLEQTLAKRKEKLGPDHPDTLNTMNNLALAYKAADQLSKALPLYEQTLAKRKEKLGPNHPDTLTTMNNLALAYQAAGQLDKALPLLEQTLAKRKEKLGPDHPDTLYSMNNLGMAYQKNGDFDKAELALRELLVISQKKQPDTLTTFNTQSQLGASLLGQKRYAEAEPLLLAGYEGMKQREAKIPVQYKARLTEALERLVQLYDAWGKKDQAEKWRRELETARVPHKDAKK